MARTNEKVTPQEFKTFEKFFADNPQLDTVANVDSFSTYLLETWQVDITPENLAVAAQRLTEAGLEILTPIQVRYRQVAKLDQNAAQFVSDWYVNQNILVKDDQDKSFENQTALLLELRGREVNSNTIGQAIGRIGQSRGLHYVQTARPVDPRQHSDSSAFMPKSESNLTALNHARKAQQARAESTPARSSPNQEPDAWKSLCDQLLHDGRHSQRAAMAALYQARGLRSWRELYTDMKQLQQHYQRLINPRAV
jgi:hypothetical protein